MTIRLYRTRLLWPTLSGGKVGTFTDPARASDMKDALEGCAMESARNEASELLPADFDKWISRDLWTLLEGAALIIGREPPEHARGPGDVSCRITNVDAQLRFRAFYERLKHRTTFYKSDPTHPLGIPFYGSIALEGDRPRPGRRQVEPKSVIALALECKIDVPGPLLSSLKDAALALANPSDRSDSGPRSRHRIVLSVPSHGGAEEAEASAIGSAVSEEIPLSSPVQEQGGVTTEIRARHQSSSLPGISKQKVLSLPWPYTARYSIESLERALGEPPKWLIPARMSLGRRGGGKTSATWNPVLLALALIDKGYIRSGLEALFRTRLPDWFDDWKSNVDGP